MANSVIGTTRIRQGDHTLVEQPDWPIEAAKQLYEGCMCGLNAAGNLVDGGDAGCLKVIGIADMSNDNTTGAAGAIRQRVRRGAFWMNNSIANPVTQAAAYLTTMKAEDNNTVAVAAGTGVAISGRILRMSIGNEPAGVLVEFF